MILTLRRYKPGSGKAISQYYKLEADIFNVSQSDDITNDDIMNAIVDYANDIIKLKNKYSYEAKQITKAKMPTNRRVYRYAPGTGRGNEQFYKFVNAIRKGYFDTMSKESLCQLIINNWEDSVE
jgi:hypothetical protein